MAIELTLRAEKGSPLTIAEGDANLVALRDGIEDLTGMTVGGWTQDPVTGGPILTKVSASSFGQFVLRCKRFSTLFKPITVITWTDGNYGGHLRCIAHRLDLEECVDRRWHRPALRLRHLVALGPDVGDAAMRRSQTMPVFRLRLMAHLRS